MRNQYDFRDHARDDYPLDYSTHSTNSYNSYNSKLGYPPKE